jgi:hypothetical protein
MTKARPSLGRDQPLEIVARVADLAGVTDSRSFYIGIMISVMTFDHFETEDIPIVPRPNGRRGRPQGTVGDWHLRKLVEMLWEAAKLHGGNLYADHKRDDGGTMIRALELLRPLILQYRLSPETWPPEAEPQRIWPPKNWPVPTIETIIKNFKASGRTRFKASRRASF